MSIVTKINQDVGWVDLIFLWRQLTHGLSEYQNILSEEGDCFRRRKFASKDGKSIALATRMVRLNYAESGVAMEISCDGSFVAGMSDIVDVGTWICTAKAILDAFGVEKVEVCDGKK